MTSNSRWTRDELLIAFGLYMEMPFGQFHQKNKTIIKVAQTIGRTPDALAMKLCNLASLDPKITNTGRDGLRNASKADREMWEEMLTNWLAFVAEVEKAQKRYGLLDSVAQSQGVEEDFPSYETTRTAQTTLRVGQDFFRRAVLSAYKNRCCISGLSMPKLLVASHIIPWKTDENNRLNPKNGLCLSVLHDKAFDLGLITVSEKMTVKVSKEIRDCADQFVVSSLRLYADKAIALPNKFQPSLDFLEHHRTHIFRG